MKRYGFYSSDEKLIEFLDSKDNVSDFVRKLVEDFNNGSLNYSSGDLDLAYKKLRNAGKELDNEIKRQKLAETPSYSAPKAIEVTTNPNIQTKTIPEIKNEKTFLALEEINPIEFLSFLRNQNNEWILKCKFCGNSFYDSDREKVLKEYSRHLKSIHEAEVKKHYGKE